MNRILFLDIDGVANDFGPQAFLPKCVEQLNRIIDATSCKLVLSSAWRYYIYEGYMSLDGFGLLLKTHGVRGMLVGMTCKDENTPELLDIPDRMWQIQEYLRLNQHDRYCVLDDLSLSKSWREFVQTDSRVGLTASDADKAISILNGG